MVPGMAETAFILIVAADREEADASAGTLRRAGHACHVVESGAEALDSLRRRRPDVIVADAHLSGDVSGEELLRRSRELSPGSAVVMVAADGDARRARDALKEHGAFDYLVKPVSPDALEKVVAEAARHARRAQELEAIRRQAAEVQPLEGIIAASGSMSHVLARIRRLAASKLTVLIHGESGTGKELVARAVHALSDRRARPLLAVNCAGFTESLLESELFGHVKGAFTGAVADRRGVFEEADGGTLFLDEIGDMPLPMQAKLLRTLENGEIVRVGSTRPIHVDVRVVAATNKILRELVTERKFRDDLYWRLNQATIHLEPLRDRREDIPPLIQHFIAEANARHGKNVTGITPEAVRLLVRYNWPGNVRQLANVIGQMVVLADGDMLDADDITDPAIRGATEIVPVVQPGLSTPTLREIEKLAIQAALRQHKGNRELAARQLDIGVRTLYRKLKEFNLE